MAAYCTEEQLQALIPPSYLILGTDDDGDGIADPGMLDNVIEIASLQVDAHVYGDFTFPDNVNNAAALVFACCILYRRKGQAGEANPWEEQCTAMHTRLDTLADILANNGSAGALFGDFGSPIIPDIFDIGSNVSGLYSSETTPIATTP